MNKNILEFYGVLANLNIAKEEAAELIHAFSGVVSVLYPTPCARSHFEIAKENLIQAVADCQNALDSMVYSLLLDRDAIKKKIEEADERAERLYRGKV